jgi:3-oxoacyl-[acyl-carrier-protein] synthase III
MSASQAPAKAPWGIVGLGTSLPEQRITAEALAASGTISAQELRSKVGFEARHQPAHDVSPWHLMVEASKAALADAGMAPDDLDLVATVGRARVEYLNWATGLSVIKGLGATRPQVFDMSDFTGGSMLSGLRLLHARMANDASIQAALLTFYQRYSDLCDPVGNRDPWTWPMGDGGGALVVRRGAPGPALLGTAFASEGRAARQMSIRILAIDEGPNPDGWFDQKWAHAKFYALRDAEKWWQDHRERASRRLPEVVRTAVQRAGLRLDDVARVQCGFLHPEVGEDLRASLGLGPEVRWHNAHGQLSGTELAFALRDLRQDASLRGKAVVLAAAHHPAEFGAAVLRM